MPDRKAIWIFIEGSQLDRKLCDIMRKSLLEIAENDPAITTQQDLANHLGIDRTGVIRRAQTLGIAEQLKKILKNKRELRKACEISNMQKVYSENV
jgi:hypothetical protein